MEPLVYLIDLEGEVVHTWHMPYHAQYGYLTERGTLFYNGKTPETSDRFIAGKPYKIGAVLEADWPGCVLWEVRHPDHHYDGIRLRNGNVLLLCLAELPNSDIGVSFRTISTVIIIDRHTGQIIWKLGAPLMCGQHAPTLLPNGNLLIFDDGPQRVDHPMPFSRIAEPILWVGKGGGTGRRMAACGSHLVNVSNVRSRGR